MINGEKAVLHISAVDRHGNDLDEESAAAIFNRVMDFLRRNGSLMNIGGVPAFKARTGNLYATGIMGRSPGSVQTIRFPVQFEGVHWSE